MLNTTSNRPIWFALIVFAVWRLWSMTFMPFTFDSPAGLYAPAMYLYEHGLLQWVYPPNIVAEPPLLHLSLALVWKLTGVHLWSAHLLFMMLTLSAVFQISRFVQRMVPVQAFPWVLALVLSEATWVAQSLQLAPDIALVFFAFWAINASLDNRRVAFAIILAALCMISVRGAVTAGGIWFASLFLASRKSSGTSLRSSLLPLALTILPSILLVSAWFIGRKVTTGFFYFNPAFVFIAHRQVVTPHLFFRNIVVMVFRLVDNGRIVFWVALAGLGLVFRREFWQQLKRLDAPVVLGATIILAFLPVTLPFTNPFNQRYFMVPFLMLALTVAKLSWNLLSQKRFRIVSGVIIAFVWCSHWVVYPVPMSIAWDSTLALVPYFSQKAEVTSYFKERGIPLNDVGFDIGECTPWSDRHAPKDPNFFEDHDFSKHRYIVLSRVQNPKNELLDTLAREWTPIADFSKHRLLMTVYQRK